MNPLRLFDYVFYSIANFYGNLFNLEHSKVEGAAIFLGMFQGINCLTIAYYIKLIKSWANLPLLIYLGVPVIFIILNFIRYYKFTKYDDLNLIWGADFGIKKIIKIIGVICYIVLTFVFLIISDRHINVSK